MSNDLIILEKGGGTGRITLNNPERLNAFTGNMRENLAAMHRSRWLLLSGDCVARSTGTFRRLSNSKLWQ